MKSDFCVCLCTYEETSRMSFVILSSQNTISIQSPQWVNIIKFLYSWRLYARLAQSIVVKQSFLSVVFCHLFNCFPFWVSFFRDQWCSCQYWVIKAPHGSDFYYMLRSKKNQNRGVPCLYMIEKYMERYAAVLSHFDQLHHNSATTWLLYIPKLRVPNENH